MPKEADRVRGVTMTVENGVRVWAGVMVLVSVALVVWVSKWWLIFTAFIGVNLIQSAFTGFCPATDILKKCGLKEAGGGETPVSEEKSREAEE